MEAQISPFPLDVERYGDKVEIKYLRSFQVGERSSATPQDKLTPR